MSLIFVDTNIIAYIFDDKAGENRPAAAAC